MNLSDIQDLWEKDSIINPADFSGEMLKVPRLHNKYYRVLISEISKLHSLKTKLNKQTKLRKEYYLGRLSFEKCKSLGWNQPQLRIIKQDLSIYIQADPYLNSTGSLIDLQELKIEFLKDVLKIIHKRGYEIGKLMDWYKFSQGN